VFSPQVISIFTLFGRGHMQWDQAVFLNRIIFPYSFFIGLAALAMAILNTLQVFGLPASTSIFFNLSVIAFSVGAVYRPVMRWAPEAYRSPAFALAIGILVGGILQFAVQVPALWRRGMRFHFGISLADPGIRQVGRLMIPGLFGIGIYQVNFFVDTVFATAAKMPGGSVTALYVADRVMELVLGSYAIAVATAILPMMARQAAAGNLELLKQTLAFSLRLVSFITIPAMVGMMVLREPIVAVLFQHGRFGLDSTALTARALLYYAAGLPAFAAVRLVVPAFYSQKDTRTPVLAAAGAMAMNIALNAIFLRYFFGKLYNGSPALASTLAAYFDCALLCLILRARHGRLGWRGVAVSAGKAAAGAAVMGVVCYEMLKFRGFGAGRFLPQAALLAGMIVCAMAVYLLAARLLGCEEIGEVWGVVFHRGAAGTAVVE
jgi:putative peptidoglycan lipid II flippase